MAVRALIVFVIAVTLIRVSNKRIFGKFTSFDIVLGIILGSILSRAITANSPFVPTICAATVLVLLHRLMGLLAFRYDWFGALVKGHHQMLVKDGEIIWKQMSLQNISKKDLEEAMRNAGNTTDISAVKYAFLERSGDISIILKSDERENDQNP
ncbi:DUF421 domain-containing protein [Fulvivirga kasyanovii]|uniref:DUF421 domain-containing protein n=2 Tax=Fulvivirga kasyanovii TaxID=396812 RepID=A0ABW9RTY3_9BACT|nr:DUF421 domain-containing protein [Fulvivirga kasyanovii]